MSKRLDPITFANDTNPLFLHPDIKTNNELSKIRRRLIANRLSLNAKKTKHAFFHESSVKDNIPLKLPDLQIANKTIERKFSIKFSGVMLDENIT